MARIQAIQPTAAEPVDCDSPIEWGSIEWVQEDAFADADYPEPEDDEEKQFLTIAIRRGKIPDSTTGSVAILGVSRDLKHGYESRFRAEVDDGTWTIVDRDGIPPAVVKRTPRDSEIPNGRRTWYRELLEQAHAIDSEIERDR